MRSTVMQISLAFALGVIAALPVKAADPSDPLMRVAGTPQYRPPKETVDILPSIEIGDGGGQKIIAAVFRPKAPSAKPLPAVVFIHGGGWRSGKAYNPFGAWLAERGYFVASIGYRLSPESTWPAALEDSKLGVRWLRANAAKYNVDPDRIGVFGTSAGAHLAACVGVMDAPELEGKGGYPGVDSRVQAVAVFCPPTDFTVDWLKTGGVPDFVQNFIGCKREEKPDVWKAASPAMAVKQGAPPFFVAHGKDDLHVPFSQSETLVKALEKAGNSVEFIPVENAGHDFFLTATTPESKMQPDHEQIMAKLLTFFDNHLKKR